MGVVEKWFDPAAPGGGDGSQGNPYATWQEWDAGEATNLVDDDDQHILNLVPGIYTGVTFTLAGWTTDETHFITIRGEPGNDHAGVIGAGLVWQYGSTSGQMLLNDVPYTVLEGFSMQQPSSTAVRILNLRAAGLFTHLKRMIIGPNAGTGSTINANVNDFLIDSTLVYKAATSKALDVIERKRGVIKNVSIVNYDGTHGFHKGSAGTQLTDLYNTVSIGTGTDFETSNIQGNNNASSDGTQPGAAGIGTITSADFLDYANDDYRIDATSQLYNAGDATNHPALDLAGNPFQNAEIGCYAVDVGPGPGEEGDVVDGIVMSDAVSAVGRYSRSVTDTMTHADGQAGIGRYVRDTSDNVELSDLIDALTELLATIADEAQYTDAIVALATLSASIQDGMTLQDTISAVTEAIATLQDQQQFTDVLDAVRARLASLSDEQAFTDMVSGEIIGSAFRSLSDSQRLTDAVTAVATYLGESTDTVRLTDILIGVVSASRSLADAFQYGDSISATTETTGFVLDVYGLTDSIDCLRTLVGAVHSAYTWTDSLSVQAFRKATATDNVVWSDTISYPALGGYLTAIVSLRQSMVAGVQIRG